MRRRHVASTSSPSRRTEVQRLLDAAADDRETHTIIATLLTTGMRRSELLGLAFDALDLDAGTLGIKRVVLRRRAASRCCATSPRADSSERTVSIPPMLVELLRLQKAHVLETAMKWGRGYRREPMFLFARPDGEPLPADVPDPAAASGHAACRHQRTTADARLEAYRGHRARRVGHRHQDRADPARAQRRLRSRSPSTFTPPPSATRPPASSWRASSSARRKREQSRREGTAKARESLARRKIAI